MPFPVAPIAGFALRYGSVALVAYAAARYAAPARRDQRVEDAMDETPEGFCLRRDDEQVNGSARWTRTYRFGQTGPGVEIDATGFARIKVRRLK
ncbi:hypothetical protein [Rhodophyticola porphyridii]|uniref:Uncharacterized protein n=1 Tax=Rhodophyticola porphyridii TaxID=1852017 RepID=A0A3L9YB44_9RHOB|nr:hypothetical protein [Rhodophyticola porphyridii]RMA43473.1 hypothetical protein D9R08_00545 [Rhodophyticola porphyridii]